MTESAILPDGRGAPLTDDQWAKVLTALPDALSAGDPGAIRPKFVAFDCAEATDLPATGMYVVLDGEVALLHKGDRLATAKPGDYFYEEHLQLSGLPVSLTAQAGGGARVAFLSVAGWFELPVETRTAFFGTLFGDLVAVQMQNFQQSINCCSVTAAALGMSALGFSCEVNDIFRRVNLPSHYVVNTGISLGELFDIACTYIHNIGLRDTVQVQAYFMDEGVTSAAMLQDAVMESARVGGPNDILIANFQVGLAHGIPERPGGHFAIIAKCNPSTGLVHMLDVHPEKYGKMWVTTVARLYAAMSDRDGGSMRARGLLRFSAREAVSTELATLAQDCRYLDSTAHLDISSEKRREMFRRATPNLNGLSVLAESFEIFGDHWASEDKLLRSTDLSYTDSLRTVRSAKQLAEIAQQYVAKFPELHLQAEFRCFDERPETGDADAEAWFRSQLRSLNEHEVRHLLVNIDLNAVLGHEAVAVPDSGFVETALLKEFWCICIGYDEATDRVTLVDMSPATSQVWQAPRSHLFRGLREKANPAMVVLQKREVPLDPGDVDRLIRENPLILFYAADDSGSQMLRTVLSNIGVTDLVERDVSGFGSLPARMRRQLEARTGNPHGPYLFLKGEYQGPRPDVVKAILDGELQTSIREAGLHALPVEDTPSLDHNIYGYPKGGLTAPRDGKRNVLLCACGSSAADKVPELVEKLTAAGHHVKLAPSPRAEHFFRDFGTERILGSIKHSDIYRDSDEWNFRYTEFGMPVRASHLALGDWADCVIVAPVTCNTMGKIANGIGDNLISSVFVAWQYQRKPVILCPACNTHMWNNLSTQANVARLKQMGATIAGPRSAVLSNGFVGIGAMATPDEILAALAVAFEDLDHQDHRVIRWAQEATLSAEPRLWDRIFRTIGEGVVGVNIVDEDSGDSLLHYAAGGGGEVHGTGRKHGAANPEAARKLIELGIDVNIVNHAGFSAMHVAMKNGDDAIVNLLLDEDDFDVRSCLRLLSEAELKTETQDRLIDWSKKFNVDNPDDIYAVQEESVPEADTTYLYFTYGSLKRGFPNHDKFKDTLNDFVGVAHTRQALPLIVQKEPACSNPNCDYLHRMATLVDRKGDGRQVVGEAYRVTAQGLKKLDALEGYHGPGAPDNTYVRKKVSIVVDGEIVPAFCYFIADPSDCLASLKRGESEIISEYLKDMATGPLKPGRAGADRKTP
jgi:3-polyprenyl-4-hydroxybenzoate decarboxylase/gamma-glutamylcyclotransferase (GGCT)/AIG2-like uncharacterized protein YtfP